MPLGTTNKALMFSAKIDYVTLVASSHHPIPPLHGHAVWPKAYRGNRLTVHDPSPDDIEILACLMPHGQLLELEIAVDLKPRGAVAESDIPTLLAAVKTDCISKSLTPRFDRHLNSYMRAGYERTQTGYRLRPFNRRIPGAHEQLLYGHRNDPVQVKVYHKQADNKRPLPIRQHCVRIETRLGPVGLDHHGLLHVKDLIGFGYRSELMGYFRHTSGIRQRASRLGNRQSQLHKVLTRKLDEINQQHWDETGVGSFLQGGRREDNSGRLLSDSYLNQRIGQALMRLQNRLS